jgi:hypothetical protein
MDQHWPLFGDASPDAVCALNFFRPNAPEPYSPLFEIVGPRLIASVMDRYTIFVAEQDDILLLPDNRIKAINLFSRLLDNIPSRFLRSF